MGKVATTIRVNYRDVSADARRCGDCFFFQRTPESDDGSCFGHNVNAVGACDAHNAKTAVELSVAGEFAAVAGARDD